MTLTDRAIAYLATFSRQPAPSPSVLEAALRVRNQPVFDAWLAFQYKYAGYVEPLGHDTAIWGIIHEQGTWLKSVPDVEHDLVEEQWLVRCADVHPSYNYLLDQGGAYRGYPPAMDFDVKIERDALIYDLSLRGKLKSFYSSDLNQPREDLLRAIQEAKRVEVAEASDSFFRYYASPVCVVVEDLEEMEIYQVFCLDTP